MKNKELMFQATLSKGTMKKQGAYLAQVDELLSQSTLTEEEKQAFTDLLAEFVGSVAQDCALTALKEGVQLGMEHGYRKAMQEVQDAAAKAVLASMPESDVKQ